MTRALTTTAQPSRAVVAVAWLMAVWGTGFAVVNVVFEATGYFEDGEYADYAAAITVMNWLVVALKLLAVAVAWLSVAKRPGPLPPRLLGAMVWGVFATLAVYVLGGMVQALGMTLGLMEDQIDLRSVGYLLFFLVGAGGWGVLAVSYSRRYALGRGPVVVGVLGAPIVLGLVLAAAPALLAALGLMPAS